MLPPGPDLGPLAQTVALHRDPLGVLRRAQARYGDVFTLRLLTARPLVMVAHPAVIDQLVESDPSRAHAGEARRRILPFASPQSIFGADESGHRLARGRVASAFSAEAIRARQEEMEHIATDRAARWPTGRPFRLLPRVRTVVDEIFVRLILGVRNDSTATALIAAIRRMLWTPGNPPVSLPGEGDGLGGAMGKALFERRAAPLRHWLSQAVDERRRDPHGNDVLGCMVAAHPPPGTGEIVDELMSTLMAAQEPPSIALTWVLDRLGREPDFADLFVADPDDPLSGAVARETLRLQPPASGVLRRLTQPLETPAGVLPAGVTVMVPLSLVQRDSRSYVDPDEFHPQRWLGGGPPAGPHLPFGGGARRCIGEHLALAEIRTVVPAVLRTLRLRPLWPQPERMVLRGTVTVPHRSALCIAHSRG